MIRAHCLCLSVTVLALAAWADYEEDRTSIEADAEVSVGGVLTVRSSPDLRGHTLRYTGVTTIVWASGATFANNAAAPGVLAIEHANDVTQPEPFQGNLAFVKEGPGTWYLPAVDSSQHTGPIEIRAGTLTTSKYGNFHAPFGASPHITVRSGATLDTNACYGFTPEHTIVLDGGTLTSRRKNAYADRIVSPKIVLTKDSSFSPAGAISLGGILSLGGYTLNVGPAAKCWWGPDIIEFGTICLASGALTLVKDVGSPTASLVLGEKTSIESNFTYSVSNLMVRTTKNEIAATIAVHGSYKPTSVESCFPRMMDGSTLDLSDLSAAANLTTNAFGAGTVTIALGARELAANETVVSWGTKPAGVTFLFKGDKVDNLFTVSESGIVYDARRDAVVQALWTAQGIAGDWKDPANWECRNARDEIVTGVCPPEGQTVTFTGDVAKVTFDGAFPFAAARMKDAFLSCNAAWTDFNLNLLTDDSILDLRGQSLGIGVQSPLNACDCWMTCATITDTTAKGGVVRVAVPDGVTVTNSCLNLSGSLAIVKEGDGVWVAANLNQSYSGRTVAERGVLRCAEKSSLTGDVGSLFGSTPEVEVRSGATLDPAGSYNWPDVTVSLAGGIISNTVPQTGMLHNDFDAGLAMYAYPFNPHIVLETDASLVSIGAFNFRGVLDSGGHRLAIDTTEHIRWCAVAATNAHLVFRSGKLKILKCFPVNEPTMTLEMNGATFDFGGEMTVSNYIAKTTSHDAVRSKDDWHANAVLNVTGCFVPVSPRFFGCRMLDGSTLALSNRTDVWSTKAVSTFGNGRLSVSFAPASRVTVDVRGRTFNGMTRVLEWDESFADGCDARFQADAETRATGRWVVCRPYGSESDRGGLWICRSGTRLIVR